MKKMPNEIKVKLRQLAKAHMKARKLELEVGNMIESYGIDVDYLTGCRYDESPTTEALAYITNSEGCTEASIDEIEEVFLWHYNNMK